MYYQPYEPYSYKGMMPHTPMHQPMVHQASMPVAPFNNDEPENGEDTSQLPMEQSYIENILRLNRGKMASVFMSYDGIEEEYRGIVEAAGRDHIIISDPETGKRYLLLMVYLNYVVFDEEIDYSYPFDQLDTYAPR